MTFFSFTLSLMLQYVMLNFMLVYFLVVNLILPTVVLFKKKFEVINMTLFYFWIRQHEEKLVHFYGTYILNTKF